MLLFNLRLELIIWVVFNSAIINFRFQWSKVLKKKKKEIEWRSRKNLEFSIEKKNCNEKFWKAVHENQQIVFGFWVSDPIVGRAGIFDFLGPWTVGRLNLIIYWKKFLDVAGAAKFFGYWGRLTWRKYVCGRFCHWKSDKFFLIFFFSFFVFRSRQTCMNFLS